MLNSDLTSLSSSYTDTTSMLSSLSSNNTTSTTSETKDASSQVASSGVVYEQSSSSSSTEKSDTSIQLAAITQQYESQLQNFEKLISSVFSKQANTQSAALLNAGSLKDAFANLEVDAETIAKAKEDISEDGYYGVDKTSERLVSFAVAIAGDDPEKLAEMKGAIEKGFEKAEKLWGGELPEISKQTFDKTMADMDELIKNAGTLS